MLKKMKFLNGWKNDSDIGHQALNEEESVEANLGNATTENASSEDYDNAEKNH